MRKFEPLLKKDSKGSTRSWEVSVRGDTVVVHHGLLGGSKTEELTVCEPKNIGRSNETTAEEQALLEAESLWTKKLKRDGYKVSLDDADELVAPMLALDYTKVPHRVKVLRVNVQPKLDGLRGIFIPQSGRIQSRKGTFYEAIGHIEEALKGCPVMLDGEVYLHGVPLNQIVSAAKKPNELTPELEYHVFDVVDEILDFEKRWALANKYIAALGNPFIKIVNHKSILMDDLESHLFAYMGDGFEGIMIRQNCGGYEKGKRSPTLFKYKKFMDEEFTVVDVKKDKDGGGVLNVTDGDVSFDVRMRGTDGERRHQWEHKEEYIGKRVTVKYQNRSEFNVPIFPVGVCFREDL